MAFGLDVEDLIYTNPDLVDQGTLEDHEVDIDTAVEKDFELRADSHIMDIGSLWYVDGTEFGGIVGKFETDPQNYQVIYTGRSFRGIQASKIINIPDGQNTLRFQGAITPVTNQILQDFDLADFFICDTPDINYGNDIPTVVPSIDIVSGTTVYDAVTKIADSIGFSYLYEYHAKDKKVHMIPIVQQDWIDLIAYNRDNTVKFKSAKNGDFINHLVCSAIDENGKRRTIHLFLNEVGELQPYTKVKQPIKDDHYILDQSKKVLKGIREIAEYYDGQISVEDNYELLSSEPSDWKTHFGNYYQRKSNDQTGSYEDKQIGSGRIIQFDHYVTIDSLSIKQQNDDRTATDLEPKTDWNLSGAETVTIISFTDDYKNWPVTIAGLSYIVNSEAIVEVPSNKLPNEYSVLSDAKKILFDSATNELEMSYDFWVSETTRSKSIIFSTSYGEGEWVSIAEITGGNDSYEPVTAIEKPDYIAQKKKPTDWENNYSYYYKQSSWNADTGKWEYSAYSSTTELPSDFTENWKNYIDPVTEKPSDWKYNYGQYYYIFQVGTTKDGHQELRAYSAAPRDDQDKSQYQKLYKEPSDWHKNFSSYYQKGYEVTYIENKKEKKKTVYSESEKKKVQNCKSSKEIFVSVQPRKKTQNNKKNYHKYPDFKQNKFFIKTSISDPPKWTSKVAKNCWLPRNVVVKPKYESGNCFYKKMIVEAPKFEGKFYRLVHDHYAQLVRNGVDYILGQKNQNSYAVTVDDFELNIGDTIGGEDEITGLNEPQVVINKIIKINRGVVDVDYEMGG